MTKDGEPMDLFAPAEGIMGPLTWLGEHLRQIETTCGGIAFHRWERIWGYKSNLDKGDVLKAEVASKDEIRAALHSIVSASPNGWTAALRKELGFKGHSMHGSFSDVNRWIGESPVFPLSVAAGLSNGFSVMDWRELGHWRRDARGTSDPTAPTPRAGGPSNAAAAPGAGARRDLMEFSYSRGEGRLGERGAQLSVRSRFMSLLRAAHKHMDSPWQELPDGPLGWQVLFYGKAQADEANGSDLSSADGDDDSDSDVE